MMNVKQLPITPTVIALTAVVILFALGAWQLERKAEKETRLSQIQLRQAQNPLSIDEAVSPQAGLDTDASIEDFPIEFEGEILAEHLFYIDNRIHAGKAGFYIVAPVHTSHGLVLANLGWLQGLGSRSLLPDAPLPASTRFAGTIAYPSDNPMIVETNSTSTEFPLLLQQIDIGIMQTALQQGLSIKGINEVLLPFVVNLQADSNAPYIRNWTPVVMPPEKHLGYAIQWFGLSIACLTVYLLSVIRLQATK